MNITVNVNGIDEAIERLNSYSHRLEQYAAEIVRRLSLIGYDVAYQILSDHIYSGETINSLTIIENDATHYTIMASSVALIFLEFGAGINGGGHPLNGEFGTGPGTYPGQKNALNPRGWWYPTDDKNLAVVYNKSGQGFGHSYGNPPYMPFYNASRKIRDDILTVAREVFST